MLRTNLQALRKQAGFVSADSFADHMGIPRATYTGYEQGRIGLSLEKAWLFADEFGCTLDELAGRDFQPARRVSSDARQDRIDAAFEVMNDKGRDLLVSIADSISRDVENRGSGLVGGLAAGMSA